MAEAAPTPGPKRSGRPEPRAFLCKNSPALPLRAVHFSDRLAFGPAGRTFSNLGILRPRPWRLISLTIPGPWHNGDAEKPITTRFYTARPYDREHLLISTFRSIGFIEVEALI
jgi:hypothetical protein